MQRPLITFGATAEQIIQKGYFSRPYLGIRYQSITPRIAAMYDLPVEWGVYVTEVASGSPAAQAGIEKGDIITRIGDVSLDETHSYINTLFTYQSGDTVTITLQRGNKESQVEVTLGESKSQ